MSRNTPNTDSVHPRVKVSTNIDRAGAETTHGNTQKSESHYAKVISDAMNKDVDKQGRK